MKLKAEAPTLFFCNVRALLYIAIPDM